MNFHQLECVCWLFQSHAAANYFLSLQGRMVFVIPILFGGISFPKSAREFLATIFDHLLPILGFTEIRSTTNQDRTGQTRQIHLCIVLATEIFRRELFNTKGAQPGPVVWGCKKQRKKLHSGFGENWTPMITSTLVVACELSAATRLRLWQEVHVLWVLSRLPGVGHLQTSESGCRAETRRSNCSVIQLNDGRPEHWCFADQRQTSKSTRALELGRLDMFQALTFLFSSACLAAFLHEPHYNCCRWCYCFCRLHLISFGVWVAPTRWFAPKSTIQKKDQLH